jgi:carboxylesterase
MIRAMAYIIIILLAAFLGWNVFLWGYRDTSADPIEPNVDAVFDQRCKPITVVHNPPSDRAMVMVHGFPSTPYTYTYAANRAYEDGYDVFVPLLPSFGTKPEDLLHTTFSQWYGYLERFYKEKRSAYRRVCVVGTSMGGTLTLNLGEQLCNTAHAPDALVTVAAPVFINSLREGVVHQWNMYFMRTVALFIPAFGTGINRGGAKQNDGEELWIGYRGTFVRAGMSLVHAMGIVRKHLGNITCPMLSFHDPADKTVPGKNLEVIERLSKATPFVKRVVHMQGTHSHHVLLMYPSVQQELTDELLEFTNRWCKEDRNAQT